MGAWIEIVLLGVKIAFSNVAPRMGAWIEMIPRPCVTPAVVGRSPHGGVD